MNVKTVDASKLSTAPRWLTRWSRLPVPVWVGHSQDQLDHAARYFPLAGIIATGSLNTKGWMLDLNYLPLQNIKLGVRYTRYDKFNRDSTNYDGFGRNAKDNNTAFFYEWFLF